MFDFGVVVRKISLGVGLSDKCSANPGIKFI